MGRCLAVSVWTGKLADFSLNVALQSKDVNVEVFY